ncbi:DUF2530 domain-containing protein [Leifsonia sp. CL154]|uniref:DUF2530 domain-containing protein n=1 Tax=Leifsonia sp. CL154 TaxID=1798214 RepID=UPI0034A262F5
MRLWLRDAERRPDPVPVKTDDRRAVVVGLALWLFALVVVVIVGIPLGVSDRGTWVGTIVVGLVLGVLGLGYLTVTRRR